MPQPSEIDWPISVSTPLDNILWLTGFTGREGFSQLFDFELVLQGEKGQTVDFEKVLGQSVTVHLKVAGGGVRHINGICRWFSQGHEEETYTDYHLGMVPRVWLLSKSVNSRVFQHMTVPDILKMVLSNFKVKYEINGKFNDRDYCVQYRESDWNFVCRLMEEEGLFYFFRHTENEHVMVIGNDSENNPDIPEPSKVKFDSHEGGVEDEDRVKGWRKIQQLRPNRHTLWDYCFELPEKHLEAEATSPESIKVGKAIHKLRVPGMELLEVYDYPGGYAQRYDGVDSRGGDREEDLRKIFDDNKRTALIRLEEDEWQAIVIEGHSKCGHFCAGHSFTLQRHFNADGKYLIVEVNHTAHGPSPFVGGSSKGAFKYDNTFKCIPAALKFRPPRLARKTVVSGTQTAVVVGPKGEEIFVDKYGRVKVQFHWDREGTTNEESSCWVRVAQIWAGNRWGASFWPRIGQEVVIVFEEGDPDQPIIVGGVYNSSQMPAYLGDGPDGKHKNDNRISGFKTSTTPSGDGFNELRVDDTKGKEQIFIHAQRNMDVRVKNDLIQRTVGNCHQVIGHEDQGDLRELIHRDKHQNVKRHHIEHIEGNMLLLVGRGAADSGNQDIIIENSQSELIKGDSNFSVRGDRKAKIGGASFLIVGADRQEKVGAKYGLAAGEEIHLKAGAKVILEAGVQLTIKAAGGFIDIGPAGVTIQGTMVLINSGGVAGSGSGSNPKEPQEPQEAKPTKPGMADDAKSGRKSAP